MYFLDTSACSEFSSTSPMPASWITNQDARVAAVGAYFDAGNQAMADLVQKLGGNLGGPVAPPLTAGVPPPVLLVNPAGVTPSNPAVWGSIGPVGGGGAAVSPAVRTSYCPSVGRPLTARVYLVPAVVPAAAGSAPGAGVTARPRRTQAQCRTSNICRDLRDGCVSSNQVDQAQLLACAKAGWSGNRAWYPDILSRPDLPYLGSPDLHPPVMTWGMQGIGQGLDVLTGGPGSSILWASLGLGAAVWWLAKQSRPRKRRG